MDDDEVDFSSALAKKAAEDSKADVYRPPRGEVKKALASDYWLEIYERENEEYDIEWYKQRARDDRKAQRRQKPYSDIVTMFVPNREISERRTKLNEAYERSWDESERRAKAAARAAYYRKHIF
jgi:hypothetical protein